MSTVHALVRHLANHPCIQPTHRYVVAVSGGPDSLALLHALCHVVTKTQLAVFHLDHGLRGAQSAADAQFVADTAQALGVVVQCDRADIAAEAPTYHNLSEAARVVRYRRMAAYAAACHADAVLVAHTQDDQAETVLMRMVRGSGTMGLAAMRPELPWQAWAPADIAGTARLIRPLLDITRATILDYCAVVALTPRQDPSNHNQDALRVRVRTHLLPMLRHEQPHITQLLAQSATIAADDYEVIDTIADQQWRTVARVMKDAVLLTRQEFIPLAISVQRALIRRAIQQVYGSVRNVSFVHIEAMRTALIAGTPPAHLPPAPIQVASEQTGMRIGAPPPHPPVPMYRGAVRQLVPNQPVECGTFALDVRIQPAPHMRTPWQVALLPHATYTLRTRQAGDRIGIGHGHHRRIQDVLVDARIPASQRDTWPLVCSGDTVVWVVGIRVDPAYCVTPDAQSVFISCLIHGESTV